MATVSISVAGDMTEGGTIFFSATTECARCQFHDFDFI
jgi:hypothetical protein